MSVVSQAIPAPAPEGRAAAALEFGYNSSPSPVRVSPSTGTVELADLVIVGSRRLSGPIECSEITLVIPTGTNSPDLALDLDGIPAQTNLPDWTADTSEQTKTITFKPTSGFATIAKDAGVTIELIGVRINRQVGIAPLRVQVRYRAPGDTEWDTDTVTLEIGKFPADFYLRNFVAKPLVIDNGDSVKLTWEAGGYGSLRLLYDTYDLNMHEENGETGYTVHDVRKDTAFYLRATVPVGSGTMERILSTLVSVRVPDLDVGTLFVRGGISNLHHATRTGGAWTAQPPVPRLFSNAPPSLVVYNDQLHCIGHSQLSGELLWTTLHGASWQPTPTRLDLGGGADPAFAVCDGKLYCVYRDPDDNSMHVTVGTRDTSQPGQLSWSTPARITAQNWTTTHKPALAAVALTLWCVFRRPNGSLYYGHGSSSGSWRAAEQIAAERTTTHGPAAAISGLIPICAYRNEDDELYVHAAAISDVRPVAGVRTTEAPALVGLDDGVLQCAYLGENGKPQLKSAMGIGAWSPPQDISPLPATSSLSLAEFGDTLHAVYQ
ncbi:hypothetical protein [Saccharopolyspora pogona]|uniref:hypothetical protein n=1 Tax=Saccharopolyspora pogona TaxID=333966 RepID=UPI0016889637|nr:hypothetical protein [Saccharopolyspora pogona]